MAKPLAPPTELEIKFLVPPGAEAVLRAHPALRPGAGGAERGPPPPPRRLVTTYFDTPDRLLDRHGASLRLRRDGRGRTVQTAKLRGGGGSAAEGLFARAEWEWPVSGDRPDPAPLAETPLGPLVGDGAALRPAFTADVRRTVRTVRVEGAAVEAALDLGRIRAGGAEEEVRELELELKEGDAAALYRLAVALHADGGAALTLGAETKADRGWRLLDGGRPRGPARQPDPALDGGMTGAAAVRRIVEAVAAALVAGQPAAAAGDARGVHQMRIAVRRLRAALALFRPHLEPHAERRFTAALRDLGRLLGEARDWDVFCAETLAAAEAEGVDRAWLDLLRGPAEAERAAAHGRVAEGLRGPALTGTVLGLAAWAADPAALAGRPGGGDLAGRPLRRLAPALVGRLERAVRRRGRHLGRRTDEELHDLRKAAKRLRYAVEFLAPLHPRRKVKAYLAGCKAVLDQLGAVNDAAVAVGLAERLGGEDAARRAELAPAVAALAGWAEARRGAGRRRLRDGWRAFRAEALPT